MMYKTMGIVLLGAGLFNVSHALPSALKPISPKDAWFVGIEAGALWPNTPSVMTVSNGSSYASPYNLDRYSTDTGTDVAVSASVGYKWHRQSEWIPAYALALRYQHMMANDIGGNIMQYSMPEFVNYNYHWDLQSDLLSVYSKVDLHQYGRFTPFIDLGLGLALNHSGGYSETAFAGVTPRISPTYQSHRQQDFAYNVGVGVDYDIAAQFVISVSYDYQNLGGFKSGQGLSSWNAERLSRGDYKANTLSAGLTYYFDALMQGK